LSRFYFLVQMDLRAAGGHPALMCLSTSCRSSAGRWRARRTRLDGSAERSVQHSVGFLGGADVGERPRPGPIRLRGCAVSHATCPTNPSQFAKFRWTMTRCLWLARNRSLGAKRGAEFSWSRRGSFRPADSGCSPRGRDLPLDDERNECRPGEGKQRVGIRPATLRAPQSS
jgi:hypothetical protein